MTFNWIDGLVIAAFFAILLAIPALASFKAKSNDSSEYFKSAGSSLSMKSGILAASRAACVPMGGMSARAY